MSFIQFESASAKEKARQELRNAREELLKKAQKNAENRTNREISKKLRGDDNWMHPAVLNKLEGGGGTTSSRYEKKSKKKSSRKSKKERKQTKKKKRKRSSSSSSDDSSSSTEEEIAKKKRNRRRRDSTDSSSSSDDSDDNEWVEKKERQTIESYNPAQSIRELNPHWKNGGTGLPTFQKPKEDDDYASMSRSKAVERAPRGNWRKKNDQPASSSQSRVENYPSTSRRGRSRSRSYSPRRRVHSRRSPTSRKRSRSRSPPRKRHASRDRSPSPKQKPKSPENENDEKTRPDAKRLDQMDFLTDQQMNELGAKIIKAEIMGNIQLAKELGEKLAKARELRNNIKSTAQSQKLDPTKPSSSAKKHEEDDEHILLTTTDSRGVTRPLQSRSAPAHQSDLYGGRKKGKKAKAETHVGGERVRYFPDDDRYDIKQMFEREKYTTAADLDAQFADIAGKHKNPKDDMEDVFADKVRKEISDYDKDEKEKSRAICEHEQLTKTLENCDRCFDSTKMEKQLIVCMGSTVYLSLPWHEALQPGHCLISPIQHVSCSTQLDEDTWAEINDFRKALTRMFQSRSQDVVFFETARYLNRRPHLVIHCVPSGQFEMAPFYFKKAIQESEQMWSTNKQLVALTKTDLRRSIPKGLPYFWVHFGMDSGFAHVIEDQERFPANFAQEIIGGLLNLDPKAWRKPRREFNPIPKVKQFADLWKKFDCTVSS